MVLSASWLTGWPTRGVVLSLWSFIRVAEDYSKNYASDMSSAARAVSGGAEEDVDEVQQYQVRDEAAWRGSVGGVCLWVGGWRACSMLLLLALLVLPVPTGCHRAPR